MALPLHHTAALREIDRRAIAALDGDSFALMTRAAAAAFRCLRARWPEARRIVVVCGTGNNGGDGYVLARLAREAGLDVAVVPVLPDPPRSADAGRARDGCVQSGARLLADAGAAALSDGDVLVDAVFGIGLARPVEGAAAHWLRAINAAGRPVLALDLPSGLCTDTGAVLGCAVKADLTVTFLAHKRGLVTGEAPALVGDLRLEDLDSASAVAALAADAVLLDDGDLERALPPRDRTAHKGRFGHVLVVGGDSGYGGAALLASAAAVRSGAGLVSLATRAEHVGAVLAAQPEVMVRGAAAAWEIAAALEAASVIAVGPGLGRRDWGAGMLAAVRGAGKPAVYDADALNLLATGADVLQPAVITPHPGEAARLLGVTVPEVQRDRYGAAQALARQRASVAVLKGAGTVIAAPDGRLAVCPVASPAMASGGMGDVLTGVIAALLAQGLPLFDAACAGVMLHARAAQDAASGGERGTLASDVVAALRRRANP